MSNSASVFLFIEEIKCKIRFSLTSICEKYMLQSYHGLCLCMANIVHCVMDLKCLLETLVTLVHEICAHMKTQYYNYSSTNA
jgi:hypothetical protein